MVQAHVPKSDHRRWCVFMISLVLISINLWNGITCTTSLLSGDDGETTTEKKKPPQNQTLSTNNDVLATPATSQSSANTEESDGPDSNTGPFRFQYPDARERFPLPEWLDRLLQSQPKSTHWEQISHPNATFIVMTCYKFKRLHSEACEGLSDRLWLIRYYLWLANTTGRIFAIRYSQPHPLKELLVPPDDGFDWTMPDGVVDLEFEQYANRSFQEYRNQRRVVWHQHIHMHPWNETRGIFANTNLAIPQVGEEGGVSHPISILIQLGRAFFVASSNPVRGVAHMIDAWAQVYPGLVPGTYAAAHVRAKFPVGVGDIQMNQKSGDMNEGGLNMDDAGINQTVTVLGTNAVQCAVKAMPDAKYVYIATDSNEVVQQLLTESTDNFRIIARPNMLRMTSLYTSNARIRNQKICTLYSSIYGQWLIPNAWPKDWVSTVYALSCEKVGGCKLKHLREKGRVSLSLTPRN